MVSKAALSCSRHEVQIHEREEIQEAAIAVLQKERPDEHRSFSSMKKSSNVCCDTDTLTGQGTSTTNARLVEICMKDRMILSL
jgi:hypothetical protein